MRLKLKRIKEILAAFGLDVSQLRVSIYVDLMDTDHDGQEAMLRIYHGDNLAYEHKVDLWQ